MVGIIFAHLQEAFGSSRWMFRALRAGPKRGDVTEWKRRDPPRKTSVPNNPKASTHAAAFGASSHHPLHPMWQQQHDAVVADPLGLAWADELVYDALGRVVKISKLGFPEDESIWTGHGKTQLETWSQLSSRRAPKWIWRACRADAKQSHLTRRTRTGSCCRLCKELGWATGSSWGRRYVCPPLGHEEHDDGDCKTGVSGSWNSASTIINEAKLSVLENNSISFIHSTLDLSTGT